MKLIKSLILGSSAGLIAMGGAQAADLPVKAKAIEYVKVCSLYGAGFYYIPGTDTCIKIGGVVRIDTGLNGNIYDAPAWQGGATATQAYGKNWFQGRSRLGLTVDTRTASEYGVVRTFGGVQFDWTSNGGSGIAGGAPVEVDYAFIQFAGFTFGKSVSEYDPQWVFAKPTITSGFWSGSNDATAINQLAYTATFGNGVSGTIAVEDGQPYRTAGIVNAATPTLALLTASGAASVAGAYGVSSFNGNSVAGDHVPDIVGNLRLDQAWGTLHFAAAAHENHAASYGGVDANGHPGSSWGYAFTGAFQLKNLPTGVGDTFEAEAGWGHGAAKYVFGGTIDTAGAGRLFRTSGTSPGSTVGYGYILDAVYSGALGSQLLLSNAWEVTAYYEHYWNPAWRTSLFANYSAISYGATANNIMAAALSSAAQNANGFFTFTNGALQSNTMDFNVYQVGTRTAWTPVKDLTFSAEFIYSHLTPKASGFFTNTGAVSGGPAGATYGIGAQNIYNGGVQVLRSF